ncbi:MAG: hypothetical protein ACOC0G_01610, partial [Thermodesulfobacteriota bacterium]
MKDTLRNAVSDALQACYEVQSLSSGTYPEFTLEVPNLSEHGDFAVNVA